MNFEKPIEKLIYISRWLLAPLYLGLIGALLILTTRFAFELWHITNQLMAKEHVMSTANLVYAILELVDLTLVANLLLMIIFSGYENFISKIEEAEAHKDRPSWMGRLDHSAMKLKVIGSIIAITSIQLLKQFICISETPRETILLTIALHMTFVVSGLLFALMERITPHGNDASASADDAH